MTEYLQPFQRQGHRQNVFSRLEPPVTLEEAASLAEEFDYWEADVLTLRLCHPVVFQCLQALVRRN
jgi:hypothetical protein